MPTWTLDWKRGPLEVRLPDDGTVTSIERPATMPGRGSWLDVIAHAVDHPIGSPPLRDIVKAGDRVALLVTDMQDEILGQQGVGDYLIDYLGAAGVDARSITLIHAAGMHGHPGARAKIGERIIGRVGAYIEHDPYDEPNLSFLGVTRLGTPVWVNRAAAEADVVIGLGQCSPSLYGFQGGAGIILPGISAADTIRYNHARILTTRTNSAWGLGNPMREDVMDVGDLARLRFKIDCAAGIPLILSSTPHGAAATETANAAFAGYFREEWPVAVSYVEANTMAAVDPADIYVFSPGRAPALMNSIYMAIESAVRATHQDGVIIAVVSAYDHTPFPPRPLAETMAEFRYVTRRWCEETGDDNPMHAYWHHRDGVCKTELLGRSLEEISRVIARFDGEPRSTTHIWSHRRSIESRRCILVSEGVPPADGAAMGFVATYADFESAYRHARDLVQPGARVLANMPPGGAIPFVRNPAP
ncbi:MAG: DUF2088 domain-containing protein [Chloroflexota bacterium]|nr:MAG: DUF2088 domain-containing protein [Chloroflexota bacterium]